ncbi:MAG: hypothetical protein M3357_02230 [Actinomycetota bacterium]|nr:hypothetical protein [Actinomycetota bacterium]
MKWWWVRAGVAVLRRPGLWAVAGAQAWRLARPEWWRRRPFLPLPDPDYVRFRLMTAYGPDGEPTPEDVVAYLRWCRDFGNATRNPR